MDKFFENLINWDQQLFKFINSDLSNPAFDLVLPIFTDLHRSPWFSFIIVPLLLGYWIYLKRGRALIILFFCTLGFAISDSTSYRIIKPFVHRDRPEFVLAEVNLRSNSHSGMSFPSIHAANTMAAALILSYFAPSLSWLYITLAVLVAFSRVYVGVHFPLDVIGGDVVGLFAGLIVILIIKRTRQLPAIKNALSSAREQN